MSTKSHLSASNQFPCYPKDCHPGDCLQPGFHPLKPGLHASVEPEAVPPPRRPPGSTAGWLFDEIMKRVTVRWTEDKGRCLYAAVDLEPGDIVFIESPNFVSVPSLDPRLFEDLKAVHAEYPMELPPVWHFAALASIKFLDDVRLQICKDKWTPCGDAPPPPSQDVLRVCSALQLHQQHVDPSDYEKLLLCWRYNSFGHHTDSEGLVLYNVTSMMSHSCGASCSWHYGEGDSYVLRARAKMRAGDELTISYIGDEDLFKSTDVRREKLAGWLFTCRCTRCSMDVDVARGFRCQVCGAGSSFFKTEHVTKETTASPCTVCNTVPAPDALVHLVELEKQYVERLNECSKDDLPDLEAVLSEALKVFQGHWVLFSLQSMMFEAHRDAGRCHEAFDLQMAKLQYLRLVLPLPTYTLAWCLEEAADLRATSVGLDPSRAAIEVPSKFTSHQR
uniref:SET domain-containing protein n=1 Tax=Chromera velia CCMP2878 TaxID=1169474 RepID=A0A0G4H3T6_9ALVE|eukprot:Cvel_24570.t1-p1 / transcript=Cvel_24570.t1 / gene=Cvel_24570 / organism=Chromera_velia_CCMP2878 / gene_product=hypothetical protein / transcript_product=hypothetical protein / location=Cvel_scaffold2673:18509-24520(+) / protein_length=446 / sequence_SO=supercontig / SO=protein_coding / is_pseudo=false